MQDACNTYCVSKRGVGQSHEQNVASERASQGGIWLRGESGSGLGSRRRADLHA